MPVFKFQGYVYYSGRFLAFFKSCETQDKIPDFLQDLQDSKNFQFFGYI